MFTIGAYSESQDPGGVTTPIAAVGDQSLRTEDDSIIVGEYSKLIGVALMAGTTGVFGRLVSPSLRVMNPFYIHPIEQELYADGQHHCHMFPGNPVDLMMDEELELEINSDPAAAEQNSGIVFFGDQAVQPVNGKIHTVRATITLALTAGTWQYSELAFPDNLPVRNYSIVGARFEIDTAVAGRFVFKGSNHRPGCICSANAEVLADPHFRNGKLGVWGDFSSIRPPGVEVIGSVAAVSATYNVYIDVIPM